MKKGQIINGKAVTYSEFETEVSKRIFIVIAVFSDKHKKACKKFYNKSVDVEDTVSNIILGR